MLLFSDLLDLGIPYALKSVKERILEMVSTLTHVKKRR
jgi:hypothetical protein